MYFHFPFVCNLMWLGDCVVVCMSMYRICFIVTKNFIRFSCFLVLCVSGSATTNANNNERKCCLVSTTSNEQKTYNGYPVVACIVVRSKSKRQVHIGGAQHSMPHHDDGDDDFNIIYINTERNTWHERILCVVLLLSLFTETMSLDTRFQRTKIHTCVAHTSPATYTVFTLLFSVSWQDFWKYIYIFLFLNSHRA